MGRNILTALIWACVALVLSFGVITACRAHEPYTNWQRPDVGGSCCNGQDCAPTKAYWDGARWMAAYNGRYIPVPPEKVLKFPSPDGNAHLCAAMLLAPTGVTIYCFMPPEAKF